MLCVPYGAHRAVLEAIKPMLAGRILVDITVLLKPPKVRQVFCRLVSRRRRGARDSR